MTSMNDTMIETSTLNNPPLTFEIKGRDGAGGLREFYAQTHCTCGSTFGSGEYLPSMRRAVEEAREGILGHKAAYPNCKRPEGF